MAARRPPCSALAVKKGCSGPRSLFFCPSRHAQREGVAVRVVRVAIPWFGSEGAASRWGSKGMNKTHAKPTQTKL